MKSSFNVLPGVLEKIPVLIFAGDQDLICNYVGLEAMIKDLTWNGAKGLGVRYQTLAIPMIPLNREFRLCKHNHGMSIPLLQVHGLSLEISRMLR
jgi:hypothetical protein